MKLDKTDVTYEDGTVCSETSVHRNRTPHDLWRWKRQSVSKRRYI